MSDWSARAEAYRNAPEQREGEDLDLIVRWAEGCRTALDVATELGVSVAKTGAAESRGVHRGRGGPHHADVGDHVERPALQALGGTDRGPRVPGALALHLRGARLGRGGRLRPLLGDGEGRCAPGRRFGIRPDAYHFVPERSFLEPRLSGYYVPTARNVSR